MPLLNEIAPEAAEGEVADLYRDFEKTIGFVPNAFRAMSASPGLLALHWERVRFHFQHPSISGRLGAAIRMLVSKQANCPYCIGINAGILMQQFGMTADDINAMQADPSRAPLDDKEKAMLLFVLKGISDPHSVGESDIAGLRKLGWSDRDILDGLDLGAYQMAMDTLINAFKVENEAPFSS